MTLPMSEPVAQVFAAWDPAVSGRFKALRGMILTAAENADAGPVTETLKWGQPSYQCRSGTPVRLGCVDGRAAVLVHCQTSLVSDFQAEFGSAPAVSGNRAVLADDPGFDDVLALFITRALTYHRDRKARAT